MEKNNQSKVLGETYQRVFKNTDGCTVSFLLLVTMSSELNSKTTYK